MVKHFVENGVKTLSVAPVLYLQIELSEKGTHTSESMMLKMC